MTKRNLASQIPVARQIVMGGLVVALAILIASFLLLAAVQVAIGDLMFLAIAGGALFVVALMLIGSSAWTMRAINQMETTTPTEGLPALEHALSQWVEGERAALGDVELGNPDELAELELRAAWALRTEDTLADLRDQRRALPDAAQVDDNRESLKLLQARIAAAAEVNRTR